MEMFLFAVLCLISVVKAGGIAAVFAFHQIAF
jgi:hypothetical protein